MLPQLDERRKMTKNLFVRNILNALFILLSIISMVGIAMTMSEPEIPMWCYALAIIAVIVKMVEAVMRMSENTRSPRKSRFDRTNREV